MPDEPFTVTTAAQLRALASPVRSQIMDALRRQGEKSVSELAAAIGASSQATHYQVDRLVEVGLVVLAGKRRVGPRVESVYRAISAKIKVLPHSESAEYMEALLALALTDLRKIEREVVDSFKKLGGEDEGPVLRMLEQKGYLAEGDRPKLKALLEEACHLLSDTPQGENSIRIALHSFAVKLAPGS